jgi:hypothetical protein
MIDWSSSSLKTVLEYDVGRYPFAGVVSAMFGGEALDRLGHDARYDLLTREQDQQTVFHDRFYAAVDSFLPLYHRLLTEQVRPLFSEDIIFQRVPTFRIHLPANIAVGNFHVDSDFGHADGEINFWLPFTDAWATNTIWVESAPGRGDYEPVPVRYGQILLFNGVRLRHGNQVNATAHTRVSVDFRVLGRSDYRPRDAATVNTGLKFTIGEYFAEFRPEDGASQEGAPVVRRAAGPPTRP